MTVRKSPRGQWMIDVKIRRPNGEVVRERRVSPVQTKRGAQRFEHELRELILRGEWTKAKPAEPAPTLERWAEIFAVEHSQAKHLRPSTIDEQRAAFRNYLIPILGASTPIDTIRTPHFDRVRRGMAARGLAPKTTNNALAILSRAVRFFYERQGLDVPPFDSCRVKVPRSAPKFWEPEQYASLVAAAADIGPEALALVLLMGDCGLRTGEVIALEWSHVRWRPEPQITIQRSCTRGEFGPPKGGRPRTVPMTTRTAAAVRALPRGLAVPWVFTRDVGDGPTHATRSALTWIAAVVEREVGLATSRTDGQLHKLRHTYVTRLAAAGVPARTIMDLAGHEHLSTTMRCMHMNPGATSRAVAALETFDRSEAGDPHATIIRWEAGWNTADVLG